MKLILETETCSDFLHEIQNACSSCLCIENIKRESFSYITLETEFSIEEVKGMYEKWMKTLWGRTAKFIPMIDGFIGYTKPLYQVFGGIASYGEGLWRSSVSSAVALVIEEDSLLAVEFDGYSDALERFVPTVIVTPFQMLYEITKNAPNRESSLIPIYFRGVNLFANYPAYITKSEIEYLSYHTIYTPFCTIIRNSLGVGNTVLLPFAVWEEIKEDSTNKDITDLLTKKEFWKNVLIRLASEDFFLLASEFDSMDISVEMKARILGQNSVRNSLNELETLKQEKLTHEMNIRTHIDDIVRLKATQRSTEDKIRTIRKNLIDMSSIKEIEEELTRVLQLPYVQKVAVEETTVFFELEPIQVDEGPILGGYTVEYNLKNNRLKIRNDVNPMSNHSGSTLAHPHVYQDDYICLGNYSDIFFRFQIGEYCVALEMLHEFLSTYNPDDEYGRRLILWDAKYTFEDLEVRGYIPYVESEYNEYYQEIYGRDLPQCNICPCCEQPMDYCECNRCYYCDSIIGYDCECERCELCNERVSDCGCERCYECNELITGDYIQNACECDRCPNEFSELVKDIDCTDCDEIDCEFYSGQQELAV
jgi:hypothetical protein